MRRYIAGRAAQGILVLLGVTLIAFVLEHLVASGPQLARAILGPRATPAAIHEYVMQNALNKSLPQQYGQYLWHLAHGDLGQSYKLNRPVLSVLERDLPNDALVIGTGVLVAVLVAVPLGIAQAFKRSTVFDYAATVISFIFYSMPSFWLGLVLVDLAAVHFSLLPAEAPQGGVRASLADPAGLVLPVATMALVTYALFSRYMRAAAIEVLAQDYIVTARQKGVPEHGILQRHVFRNSVSTVVTLLGLSVPGILTWGMLVEYVFNFPGTGLTFYNAASSSDYPLETAIVLLVGTATVIGNLLADVLYAILDPRVRYT